MQKYLLVKIWDFCIRCNKSEEKAIEHLPMASATPSVSNLAFFPIFRTNRGILRPLTTPNKRQKHEKFSYFNIFRALFCTTILCDFLDRSWAKVRLRHCLSTIDTFCTGNKFLPAPERESGCPIYNHQRSWRPVAFLYLAIDRESWKRASARRARACW